MVEEVVVVVEDIEEIGIVLHHHVTDLATVEDVIIMTEGMIGEIGTTVGMIVMINRMTAMTGHMTDMIDHMISMIATKGQDLAHTPHGDTSIDGCGQILCG